MIFNSSQFPPLSIQSRDGFYSTMDFPYIVLKRKQVFLLFLGHLGVPIKQLLSPQLNLSESGGWNGW